MVTGGRTGWRHGDGRRRQRPPCEIVPVTSFFNCSAMRLWEIRMNGARPYFQMWRGVWVSFCKIVIVSFLSVRYRLDGLYCRMAGTPSSRTLFFIRVEIFQISGAGTLKRMVSSRSGRLVECLATRQRRKPGLRVRQVLLALTVMKGPRNLYGKLRYQGR